MTGVIIGAPAPDVEFRLLSGTIARPSDFRGQKLVIFFCDGREPSSCAQELREFADLAVDFARNGTWILGLVRERHGGPGEFMLPRPPIVPVALDPHGVVSAAFGLGPARGRIAQPRDPRDRATFLIDRDGTVDRIWRNPRDIGHALEVLEAARELT